MNKKAYFAELEKGLAAYPWAQDPAKLERYMKVARECLEPEGSGISFEIKGVAAMAAWRAIGGKGKPSYKALRALPEA